MKPKFKSFKNLVFISFFLCLSILISGATQVLNYSTASALSGAYPASDVLGQVNFTDDTSGTSASSYNNPWGSTAIDTVHHRLFVSDPYNDRVLIYDLDSNDNLVSHSANNVLGEADFTTSSPSISADPASVLYYPTGLVYDSVNNRLFVATDYDVDVFDLNGGVTNGMDASYELGQASFGDSSCTVNQSTMCGIYGGLAFDPANGRLFVIDEENSRVLAFNVDPNTISNGENADYVLGQPNFTSTGSSSPTQNGFGSLEYAGLAYNPNTKELFVSDASNNRILVFDLSNGITNDMDASYVIGQTDFSSGGYSAISQSTFEYNLGLGIDTQSNQLFVDDTYYNCRVLVFDLSHGITNGMNASGVLGQSDFTSNSCSESQSGFGGAAYSNNIAFDPTEGRLYFPDYEDSRVLIFNFVHITNASPTTVTTLSSGKTGSFYSQSFATVNYQGNVTYSLTGGSLPPGLVLYSNTGVVSGTPTTPGTYTFEITVTDNTGTAGVFTEDPTYTIVIPGSSVSAPNTGYGIPNSSSGPAVEFVTINSLLLLVVIRFYFKLRQQKNSN